MLNRLPQLAARCRQPILTSSSRLHPRQQQARLALPQLASSSLRLASTQSAAHDLKGSDGGHHEHHAAEHHGHEDHYDPPGGWLWGVRPGEKAEKEGWEPFAWIFVGAWVVAVAAYTLKEDTSIQTWALEEARRRLEKEGFYDESK